MAVPTALKTHKEPHRTKRTIKPSSSSWSQFRSLITCKQAGPVHDPKAHKPASKLGSSCRSLKDVVHGTRVVHRADVSPENSSLLTKKGGFGTSSGRSNPAACPPKAMQFTKLSGCYECRIIVDPPRHPSPRTVAASCPKCGEVFTKAESLEVHQRTRHAVSELGAEDSSRNIVEIIFKSSWLKKESPMFTIERILKVHNTQRTIQRFEDCRDAVKARAVQAARKNPRCAADGNELLRFHCTTLSCALGSRASSSLCASVPACGVCTIIRHGFQGSRDPARGVRTTASSGRAHDLLSAGFSARAMIVCRVIAGRVGRVDEESGESACDSLGVGSNLEELHSFNAKAILPCFVVIYRTLDS